MYLVTIYNKFFLAILISLSVIAIKHIKGATKVRNTFFGVERTSDKLIFSESMSNLKVSIKEQAKVQKLDSLPFSEVLRHAKTLMGQSNAKKVDEELKRIRSMNEDDILNYFVNTNFNNDVKNYWFYYYLLAKVALYNDPHHKKQWKSPILNVNDAYYSQLQKLNNKDLFKCRNSLLSNLLSNKEKYNLKWDEEFSGRPNRKRLELFDFNYDLNLIKAIKKQPFYKHVESNFPKGVIHHYHWTAGFDGRTYYDVIASVLNSKAENDNERLVFYSVDMLKDDKSKEGAVKSGKIAKRIGITQLKYILPETINSMNLREKYKDNIKIFENNFVDKSSGTNNCLTFDINPQDTSDPFSNLKSEPYAKGFFYTQLCNHVVIYDDYAKSKNVPNSVNFKGLKHLLETTTHVLKTDLEAIRELPESYIKENNQSVESLSRLGIWTKFEDIFLELDEILDNMDIVKALHDVHFKTLKNQKVIGLEIRDGKESLDIVRAAAKKYEVLFSYIIHGRKAKRPDNEAASVFSTVETDTDTDFAGYDFYAYEDDPYSGARNFFTLALTEVIQGTTSSYFDKMFANLNSKKGKFFPHAGETLYFPGKPVSEEYAARNYINDNIIHAALLPEVKRIGHGLALSKNTLLQGIIAKRNISLEICPISNQVLNYYYVNENPFVELLRKGINLTISPDDPGFFGYLGVGFDWFYILMVTDLQPSELYLLLKYSLEHSSIKEIQKDKEIYKKNIFDDLTKFYKELEESKFCTLTKSIPLPDIKTRKRIVEQSNEKENLFLN